MCEGGIVLCGQAIYQKPFPVAAGGGFSVLLCNLYSAVALIGGDQQPRRGQNAQTRAFTVAAVGALLLFVG